ncbi:MAG: PqqD family protein [Candidatus Brocadiae bacterium]|nr:PqqD family protein [Candidatus Brocadiia bacterium]
MSFARLKQIAISDSGFIFNPLNGDMFQANSTGLFLLEQCKQQKSIEDILSAFVEEFDVEKIEAEKDFDLFLKQIAIYGIIEKKQE